MLDTQPVVTFSCATGGYTFSLFVSPQGEGVTPPSGPRSLLGERYPVSGLRYFPSRGVPSLWSQTTSRGRIEGYTGQDSGYPLPKPRLWYPGQNWDMIHHGPWPEWGHPSPTRTGVPPGQHWDTPSFRPGEDRLCHK